MARTPSTMLELGIKAPDFSLIEPASGTLHHLSDFAGKPLLVIFICNHCPYVIHIARQLALIATVYQQQGIAVVAINSNDVSHYPADAPERMVSVAEEWGFTFPYLFDESQAIAKAYRAACTPDLFLFDVDHKLVYRGQFDSARPGNELPVNGADLTMALDGVLAGEPPLAEQHASLGCNIKWTEGNEPDYF